MVYAPKPAANRDPKPLRDQRSITLGYLSFVAIQGYVELQDILQES